jgi:multidrug efflux pump subunit AcrB
MSISSDTMSESSLYDYGYNFIRTQMATVQGASFPLPYGGRPRQIMVDIDLKALYAQGLPANGVVNAINAQSLIIPSGIAKIGPQRIRSAAQQPPPSADAFNSRDDLPEIRASLVIWLVPKPAVRRAKLI